MISFVGDVYLDKRYNLDFDLGQYVCNLEAPICENTGPAPNKVNLCSNELYFHDSFPKPQSVCLANNHIMDFGCAGILNTVKILKKNNISYFGISGEKYCNTLELQNKKIVVIAFVCPTTNPAANEVDVKPKILHVDSMVEEIKNAKLYNDFVVVQFHWGLEEVPFPKYEDVLAARLAIDSGADLILGHHAHVIQSHEIYNGKNIFYGLGNFLFPDLDVPSRHDGKRYTSLYKKEQLARNRKSVVVTVDNELVVSHYFTKFDSESVFKIEAKLPSFIPSSTRDFERKLSRLRRLRMIGKLINQPQLLSFKSMKRFFRY
jgi:hypothetical protein